MFQSPKEYRSLGTLPAPGCFATKDDPYDWENCREEFSQYFNLSDPGLFFSISPGQIESVSSFICRTENILTLPENSTFSPTNYDEIMWVNIAPFWREDLVRCSLFTILLRCGRCYNIYQDKYEPALFSEWQAGETRNAIYRFLFGYTKYVPPQPDVKRHYKQGWHWLFKNMDDREVRRRLISPDNKSSVCFAGNESLWI
tara:strand:+ start:6243 stop:6842 length:600 start_codon:yes stop_codon:yes gene_type:complete